MIFEFRVDEPGLKLRTVGTCRDWDHAVECAKYWAEAMRAPERATVYLECGDERRAFQKERKLVYEMPWLGLAADAFLYSRPNPDPAFSGELMERWVVLDA